MEAFRGTISRIERNGDVRLRLDTAEGSLAVHLGPAAPLRDVVLAAGDLVEGRGQRVFVDGEPVLLAMTVVAGGRTVLLRDDDGRPSRG